VRGEFLRGVERSDLEGVLISACGSVKPPLMQSRWTSARIQQRCNPVLQVYEKGVRVPRRGTYTFQA